MKTIFELFTRASASLVKFGVVLLSLSVPGTSYATAIYEYRDAGSSTVIGTLELQSPPASTTGPWTISDLVDVIALYLDDSVFGLGSGNLLLAGFPGLAGVQSFTGSQLDAGGGLGITFPTIPPANAGDPTRDRSLALNFDSGAPDGIAMATIDTFPDGQVFVGDLFLFGDWTAARAAVPEPTTLTLLMLALAGLAWVRRRGVAIPKFAAT